MYMYTCTYVYICGYIYIYIYHAVPGVHLCWKASQTKGPGRDIHTRPRENMVGVDMVLALYPGLIFISQDLYNPCFDLMNSARTMFTPTMFSRSRHTHARARECV